MASSISIRHLVSCCLLCGLAAVCAAQAYTPPPPRLTTLPACPVPKDEKEAKKIAKRRDCDPTNRPVPAATPASPAAAAASDSAAKAFPYPGNQPPGQPQPAKPADGSDSAAKAFPYPGETPAKAPDTSPARQYPYPGDQPGTNPDDDPGRANPNVPHDPAAEKKAADTTAGKAFPYPGDPAPAAAPASATSAPAPEASSSSSSSSSSSDDDTPGNSPSRKAASSDDDDDQPKLADKGSEGKRNNKTVKSQTDTERVDEDLSVAKFYGQSGNAMGAYLRAKDAVKTQPEFPEARFVLGEAAKRLKKTEEAKAEFNEYLKLAPDGEHARAAQQALAELP